MKSMTGFGRGIAEKDGRKITIDIKSVNHRFSDYSIKFPRTLLFCEDIVRSVCSEYLTRGHMDVFVLYENTRDDKTSVSLDLPLAKKYSEIASKLADEGFENDLTASRVMKMPDVIELQETEDDIEIISELCRQATEQACENLVAMRVKEGEKLKADLNEKLSTLERLVTEIAERAPSVVTTYAEKLRKKVSDFLQGAETDEARLLTEVCLYADKVAIDEELTRLKTHFAHTREMFEQNHPVGKKLDFTVQEINREINTTGSKSNDMYITERVIEAKNELEKFREQVQNIE